MGAAPPACDRVPDRIRVRHYHRRTEQAYCDWIRRFIHFPGKRHSPEVDAHL